MKSNPFIPTTTKPGLHRRLAWRWMALGLVAALVWACAAPPPTPTPLPTSSPPSSPSPTQTLLPQTTPNIPLPTATLLSTATPIPSPTPKPLPAQDPDQPLWVYNPTDRTLLHIDPVQNEITNRFTFRDGLDAFTYHQGFLWVIRKTVLSQIDPQDGKVLARINLPGQASLIASVEGALWVGVSQAGKNQPSGVFIQVDTAQGRLGTAYKTTCPPQEIAGQAGKIWILSACQGKNHLDLFDPQNGQINPAGDRLEIPLPDPLNLVTGQGAPWMVTLANPPLAFQVDPETLQIVTLTSLNAIMVQAGVPIAAKASLDSFWIALDSGQVLRLDLERMLAGDASYFSIIESGKAFRKAELISNDGSLWLYDPLDATLIRIDPQIDQVVTSLSTGNMLRQTPTPLAASDGLCPKAPLARLFVDSRGSVSLDPPITTHIRQKPGFSGKIMTQVGPGKKFSVRDGPVCVDGITWWQVQLVNGLVGWMAEGDQSGYWLVPED